MLLSRPGFRRVDAVGAWWGLRSTGRGLRAVMRCLWQAAVTARAVSDRAPHRENVSRTRRETGPKRGRP